MPNNATQETKKGLLEKTFESSPLAVIIALVSAVTAIANLWSVSKLAPIAEGQAVLEVRVSAHDQVITTLVPRTELTGSLESLRTSIIEFKDNTNKRLDSIDRKLDR